MIQSILSHLLLSSLLVLDVGNSDIVGARYDDQEQVTHTFRIPEHDDWQDVLEKELASLPSVDAAYVGSVNRKVCIPLMERLTQHHITAQLLVHDTALVQTDPRAAKQVGADLLANACAAAEKYEGNTIVVDAGTALTVQANDPKRRLLGVSICPGLSMTAEALHRQTDGLPMVTIARPKECAANDTEECICSGVYYGFVGTIDRIVTQMKREVFGGEPVTVIMTGGITTAKNNPLLQGLQEDLDGTIDYFDPELTLSGFYRMAKVQQAKTTTE